MCDSCNPKKEMRWRIARTLLDARYPGADGLWSGAAIAQAKKEALLVLEAMRKPTKLMMEAGYKGSGENSYNVARGSWDSMIDCAITGSATSWKERHEKRLYGE